MDSQANNPIRRVSSGVSKLVSQELQEVIWSLHKEQPLLPSIFQLNKGRHRQSQIITHLCLVPYYYKRHSVNILNPLNDIRITVLQIDNGLMMRLSNKKLEEALTNAKPTINQGELEFD